MADVTTVVDLTTPGAGTFVVPARVTELTIEMLGASGGGGYSGFLVNAGGSGAGGGSADMITVTPGETIHYIVGAPGAGATASSAPGTAGGHSQVSRADMVPLVRAPGGAGGSTSAGGAGGAVANAIGATKIAGGNGDQAGGRNGYGGNAPTIGSLVGAAGRQSPAGGAGVAPGGGASSGGTNSPYNGGAGARGHIRITYTVYDALAIGSYVQNIVGAGASRWRAPATGKILVQQEGAGAGGNGGILLARGGGGGGGGAYADKVIDVIEGQWFDVVNGAGGAGGPHNQGNSSGGSAGQDSTFSRAGTTYVRAKGAPAPNGATGEQGGPGGSATDSVGDTKIRGYGGVAIPAGSVYNAGTGGAGARPLGGPGSTYGGQGQGQPGTAPGGGGSGGGQESGGTGGAGAAGGTRISYIATMGVRVIGGVAKNVLGYYRVQGGVKTAQRALQVKGGVARETRALTPRLDQRLMPYPSWLPAGDEALFNRATGVYNWTAGAPNTRAALAAGHLLMADWGDSLTEGFTYLNNLPPFDSSADRLNAWPMRARAALAAARGISVNGTGLVRACGTAGRDPRWTPNGQTDNGHYVTLNGAQTMTFASDIAGTRVALVLANAVTGTVRITIDNGTPVDTVLDGTGGIRRIETTGLPDTTHTVVVGVAAGNVRLVGADVYKPGGLRFSNLGQGGATASGTGQGSWSDTSLGLGNMLPVFGDEVACHGAKPDATTVFLGANDLGGTGAKDYDGVRAALDTIGTAADDPASDVLLLVCPHTSTIHGNAVWSNLYSRMYTLAKAKGWAIVDLEWLTGGFENLAGYGYTGDVFGHYNNDGANYIGGLVSAALQTA